MESCQSLKVEYDFELGKTLFERQAHIIGHFHSDIFLLYSANPGSYHPAGDIAEAEPSFRQINPKFQVPLTTICRLEYHIAGFAEPFLERIARFDNVLEAELALRQDMKTDAGDISSHVFNQIALRLEAIQNIAAHYGNQIVLSFDGAKRTVVTPDVIDLTKDYSLPQEIAFLRSKLDR